MIILGSTLYYNLDNDLSLLRMKTERWRLGKLVSNIIHNYRHVGISRGEFADGADAAFVLLTVTNTIQLFLFSLSFLCSRFSLGFQVAGS